jgi:hypothetical protein
MVFLTWLNPSNWRLGMKRLTKLSWLWMAFLLPALSACGAGKVATPVDMAPIYTQIASTALALQTQTARAVSNATDTPQVSVPSEGTPTPLLTGTSLPGTPSATPVVLATLNTPQATSQTSCDNMVGVTDVNYPDGYSASPGEVMDKTWRIKNLGPCTWNKNYVLAYGYGGAGTDWNTASPGQIDNPVLPGASVEITIVLKAPSAKGAYGAYFRMMNDKGFFFGNYVWISITVD